MTGLKHNKKRNTAFLYEAIIKEATKAIIDGDQSKKDKIIALIKENFTRDSLMRKDLLLYKSLMETSGLSERTAEKLLYETKREHSNLNKKDLFNEQTRLINRINKEVSKNVFNNFVPNYKSLATIYQIFNNDDMTTKERVLLEESTIGNISTAAPKETTEEEMRPIDNLVYNKFVERFNSEYGHLLEEQKRLLQHIINAVDDEKTLELNVYLNEEIENVEQKLVSYHESGQDNPETTQKVEKVMEILKKIKTSKIDKEEYLKILQIQELVKEISE